MLETVPIKTSRFTAKNTTYYMNEIPPQLENGHMCGCVGVYVCVSECMCLGIYVCMYICMYICI